MYKFYITLLIVVLLVWFLERMKIRPPKVWFPILRWACILLAPFAISLITVLAAHVMQKLDCPQNPGVSNVSLAGEYEVQNILGSNNRGSFTKMPLDQLDDSSMVTLRQGDDWLEFEYTDSKNRNRSDRITPIGKPDSKWSWITNGVAGCGISVRGINLYKIPGLVLYDQRGSLIQTQKGLTLNYTWAAWGAMSWIIPWKNSERKTQITLNKIK